jgi:hypothetical protein
LKKIWEKFSLFLPSFLPCSDRIQIVRFCCSGKEEITHTWERRRRRHTKLAPRKLALSQRCIICCCCLLQLQQTTVVSIGKTITASVLQEQTELACASFLPLRD